MSIHSIPILDLIAAFEFLDTLRDTGRTNMFGAAPHLADACHFDRSEAGHVLSAWMATYDDRSAEERAYAALEAGAP